MTTMQTSEARTTTSPGAHRQSPRRAPRFALAASIALLAAVGVASPSAAAQWQYYQLDSDRFYDAATIDTNGNGWIDRMWFDVDNDSRFDTHVYNSIGHESFLEVVTYDFNEDGRLEAWAQDVDQRSGFDIFYVDSNRDGRFEGPYATSVAGLTRPTIVGGIPRPDGLAGLTIYLAGLTGNVVR